MANKPANTAQKKWMSDIAGFVENNGISCLYYGYEDCHNFQLHHVLGRSAKHNKVSIGHWFIIPVPFDLHDVSSNHELNVTHHKKSFADEYGSQRQIFHDLFGVMNSYGYDTPPIEVYNAIMDTRA